MSYSRMSNGDELEADYVFEEFEKLLDDFSKKAEESNVLNVLEIGANEFVNELLKLPKPKSQITAARYTHLVDSFSYRKRGKQFEIGWGKYYGPMVERGTVNMKANPHLMKTWDNHKDKIYKKMIERIDL